MVALACLAFSLTLLGLMAILQSQPTPAEVIRKLSEQATARAQQAAAQTAEETRKLEVIRQTAAQRHAERLRLEELQRQEVARVQARNAALRWRREHAADYFYHWLRG